MRIMVTGGAGYIGSHVVRALVKENFDVVIYDNLSLGHRAAVAGLPLVEGDVGDQSMVAETVRRFKVTACVHLAAFSQVAESVKVPAKYYANNALQGLTLIDTVRTLGVKHFVFSSSAAVYGEPRQVPIPEDHPLAPLNPYGESKAFLETVLRHYAQSYDFRYISLRYFNAAGADPSGLIGEDHHPETHLIPNVLQVALGQRDKVVIYGDDYQTHDGTAVRDYVHVGDLARAHILALEALLSGASSNCYNLGNGLGFSVRQVIATAQKVTTHPIPCEIGPRRHGDPAVLVASPSRIRSDLGWQPRLATLEKIIASAWRWHLGHSRGYS